MAVTRLQQEMGYLKQDNEMIKQAVGNLESDRDNLRQAIRKLKVLPPALLQCGSWTRVVRWRTAG